MSRRALPSCTAVPLLLLGCFFPSLARAEAPSAAPGASAEELFEDARRDLRAGRTAAACPKLEESQRLDPGVGTLLHLGECYERLGLSASAWATFREAVPLARKRGDHDRARLAEERIAALSPRLARLVIEIPEANRVTGLRLQLDDAALGAAIWGVAMPVNPGAHTLRIAGPDQSERSFVITTDAAKTTRWVLPSPETPVDASAATATPAPAPTTTPPHAPEPPTAPRSTLVTAGAISGGVLLAAGGFFGVRALTDWRSSRSYCDADNACDPPGLAAIDRAKTSATVATALLATGALVSATTLVLYLKSSRGPQLALGARGVSLSAPWP